MTPRTPIASAARTRQKAPRAPKVRARDFLIEMPRFGVPASSAKAHRIWEKSPLGKKAASDVPVDGNGNVRALVQTNAAAPTTSGIVERYAYDGFGRELAGNTPAANSVNSFWFSTKQADAETGMSYYGYRYYDSNNGRWINRDPIAERGGNNVYAMIGNDLIYGWDKLGLMLYPGTPYSMPCETCDLATKKLLCKAAVVAANMLCKRVGMVTCQTGCVDSGPFYVPCVASCLQAVFSGCTAAQQLGFSLCDKMTCD